MWLVRKLWVDPLENRDAYGYRVVGYVTDAKEAERISNLAKIPKSKYPWPLDYHPEQGDYVSVYKVTELKQFDIEDNALEWL